MRGGGEERWRRAEENLAALHRIVEVPWRHPEEKRRYHAETAALTSSSTSPTTCIFNQFFDRSADGALAGTRYPRPLEYIITSIKGSDNLGTWYSYSGSLCLVVHGSTRASRLNFIG